MLRLMGQRRRLGCVIIPRHREYTAVLAGAGSIGMFDDIHAAVDTRPLAVPHAKHAIVLRMAV